MLVRYLAFLACFSAFIRAGQAPPETLAAFDRYVKLTEDGFAQHQGPEDFLWLDRHSKEKTLVWLRQSVVTPLQTLDQGRPIEVPNGVIQHWLGAVYVEGIDVGNANRMMLNFPLYKDFFRQQIIESKLTRQDGDRYEVLLRLYKKKFGEVVLNVDETAQYTVLDPRRWTLAFHSTHIGEVEHAHDRKKFDQERSPEDVAGYLWRLNLYVRVQQADSGVYIETEVISLAHQPQGKLSASHYLDGFQDFPREFTQGMVATFETFFGRPKRG